MKLQRRLTPNALRLTPKSAFSLIELSIVLLTISVMVIGIMKGGNLVSLARLMNARSFTSNSPVPKIEGLLAWYETSSKISLKESESYDGAQISTWYDINPNSIANQRNKLTRTASASVVYRAKGIAKIPSLEFDGTGMLSISSFYQGNSSQNTIFLVFHHTTEGSFLLGSYTGQPFSSIGIMTDAVELIGNATVDTATVTNPANFVIGNDYVVAVYFNGTSSGAYANNATTLAGNGYIDPSPPISISGLTVGTGEGGTDFTGLISEIIIYNRPLKLQERKDVMSYLSKKYQIIVAGL